MKYNFDTIIERHNTNSLKYDCAKEWGVPEDAIPMWVADMNFAVAPSIPRAIMKRMEHPVYGYFEPRNEYYDAIINISFRNLCLSPQYHILASDLLPKEYHGIYFQAIEILIK